MERPFRVIAEIGQNHNGNIRKAKHLVDLAKDSGCIGVKSAKRDIDSFPKCYKSMPYDNPNSFGKTYYQHRCKLELSNTDYEELCNYAKSKGLIFGSSFTDIPSLNFVKEINVSYLKIASSRIADIKLLQEVNKSGFPIMISVGMSDINMIETALRILKDSMVFALMQCTSSYPSRVTDLNINVLDKLREYEIPLGFSSHNGWYEGSLLAYLKGAQWFEYHITDNKTQKGTEHKYSLLPEEFKSLRNNLYNAQLSLGDSHKDILECELPYLNKLRSDL